MPQMVARSSCVTQPPSGSVPEHSFLKQLADHRDRDSNGQEALMEIAGSVQRRPLILVSLLLAAFVINLDITIVNVALPTLVRELHASNSQLQWVVDAYSLVFAALLLAAGSLSDRLGRKGFLLAGLAVFGLASVAGGLTSSPGQLIVARCFMGLGAAMIFPATLSLLSNVFTDRGEPARAIGLCGPTPGPPVR